MLGLLEIVIHNDDFVFASYFVHVYVTEKEKLFRVGIKLASNIFADTL